MKVKRAALVAAAEDMNEVMGLTPPINTKLKDAELLENVIQESKEVDPSDELEPTTWKTLEAIGAVDKKHKPVGDDADDDADEDAGKGKKGKGKKDDADEDDETEETEEADDEEADDADEDEETDDEDEETDDADDDEDEPPARSKKRGHRTR